MLEDADFEGICELTLETDELEILASFYRGLGLRELDRQPDRIWFASGSRSRIGIWSSGKKEHSDQGGRHVHFALSVSPSSLDRILEVLRTEEVDFEGPVEHDGGDRSVYFDDPAGNRVELWNFFERKEGGQEGVEALADSAS